MDQNATPKSHPLRRIFRFLRNVLAVLGLFFLIYHLGFDLHPVVSPSMSPTLQGNGNAGGDWVLAERISYRFRNPRRWEVVEFRNSDGLWVAKRVVALPGETVSIQDGRLAINGSPIPLPPTLSSLRYRPYGSLRSGQSASTGNGYFVLGDDSRDSQDSRFEGPVARHRIRARAWLIAYPFSRFGPITP